MTKLLEFPKKMQNITWTEAMEQMMKNGDDNTKETVVRNMLIISETQDDYSFGMLNTNEIRSMLGTLECVKGYLIDVLSMHSEYEFPEE